MRLLEVHPTLTPALAAEVIDNLRSLLPKPVADKDTDEARAAREQVAMSAVAALYPADTFEALLAAQIVAADAHAKECLRAASALDGVDDKRAMQCRAQANSMMRQMQSGYRALQRRQTQRDKDEAAHRPAAMEQAGYWWRDCSVPAEPPPPSPAAAPLPEPATTMTGLSEAELYATLHPERAADIRRARGVPPGAKYGPPEPELTEAIVTSTSPILLALDQRTAQQPLKVQPR